MGDSAPHYPHGGAVVTNKDKHMKVITRFAPSPTGYLHIGGARTALFNYLFARHNKGTYLLRIEDTDRERSNFDAIEAILGDLRWLGITSDRQPILQSTRLQRHQMVAETLLRQGKAYHCYTTPEELQHHRQRAQDENIQFHYYRKWRETMNAPPKNGKPVVRLKCPTTGKTRIKDLILGTVELDNARLDDYVLLRQDGTPTYMLSAVVDDIDMGITHIIRGDDHLNNAYRQYHLFEALGASIPTFAHIPLIHGSDGKKLSKRHGAVRLDAYRKLGYLPEALVNYLCNLGWHFDGDHIFSLEQAIANFTLEKCGRSSARMDKKKLDFINSYYIRNCSSEDLYALLKSRIHIPDAAAKARLKKGLEVLKMRATTLEDVSHLSGFIVSMPSIKEEFRALVFKRESQEMLRGVIQALHGCSSWTLRAIEDTLKAYVNHNNLKFATLARLMRLLLSGKQNGPSIAEMLVILGRIESIKRLSIEPQE